MAGISLIVGLGNPGAQYQSTRHNAGFWFVDALAQSKGERFRHEAKFHGETCRLNLHGQDCWLLKPATYMNRSGQSVAAFTQFYKIAPDAILVAHDELDLPPGQVRLKQGGGHGGHNGLRDITAQLGTPDFVRLRIGIGHPGASRDVSDYVLHPPGRDEFALIEAACARVYSELPKIIAGDLQKAMNHLHSQG